MIPVKKELLCVDGIEMYYSRFGTGEKYLCIIPGLSVTKVTAVAELVAKQYARFAKDYTVFIVDQRENIPEDYSVKKMAADIARVTDFLGVEKSDFFGASLGGMITLQLMLDFPQKVNRGVICSSASRMNDQFERIYNIWRDLARKRESYKLTESFFRYIHSEKFMEENQAAFLGNVPDYSHETLEHFIKVIDCFDTFDVYDRLEEISCPLLAVASDGDAVMNASLIREIAEKTHCEMYIYGKDFGHAVYDETPDFTERMYNFLQKEL